MRARWIALALIVGGCSVVNDPGRHRGGSGDDGGSGRDGGSSSDAATDALVGDAGPAPVEALELCDRLIDVYCRARLQCCDAAASETMQDCIVANDTACEDTLRPYLLDGRNAYSPGRAGVELAELEGYFAGGACGKDVIDWVSEDEGFLSILRGTFPTGESCGALDLEEVFACERPRVCARTGAFQWQCQPRGESGGPCWDNAGCPETEYCLTAAPNTEGTCAPKLADGEVCAAAGDCASRLCAGMTTMTCQERTADVYCTEPFAPFRR